MIHQPVIDIAEIFARKNVKQVVISPGSRSAPLTLAFARHSSIETKVIPDERSAAFIALGMAESLNSPVGLVCTSGSAALNYYPAIAESYFQNIPLIILTADRPKEWIGQYDGQTIYQNEIYSKHIKKSYELNADFSHKDSVWYAARTISEAINFANEFPKGPVHINIPLREPLYPASGEQFEFRNDIKVIESHPSNPVLSDADFSFFVKQLAEYKKVLIIGGQGTRTEEEISIIKNFTSSTHIPLVGDILSNLHSIDSVIHLPDTFLNTKDEHLLSNLRPDLLITFGASVISKNLKLFLRKFQPKEQWHLLEAGVYADTFQSLTRVVRVNPFSFFNQLQNSDVPGRTSPAREEYASKWQQLNQKVEEKFSTFFHSKPFTEFEAAKTMFDQLPTGSALHLANSMPVRYANFIGLKGKKTVSVYSNRGTSGIDGCTSTAVGASFVYDKPVVLLTGDMAFFYDRNAFWHNYPISNLRVVILNNHGGGIFGLIDGPADLPEREEYFETTQKLRAENTAKDFGLDYYFCNSKDNLTSALKDFFSASSKGKILEIETDKTINRKVFVEFKEYFK